MVRHLIIGAGTVGKATGIWLESHNEQVLFFDKSKKLLRKLKEKRHNTVEEIMTDNIDLYWICTAEWNVEDVLKRIEPIDRFYMPLVIRSTMKPGATEDLELKYKLNHVAHVPEFLKEATALDDVFHPDRIIIGTKCNNMRARLESLYRKTHPGTPVIFTSTTTSETIKLASNAWLATQISFWNEIKNLCGKMEIDPQEVANGCTLDKRISKYGTKMIGAPFSGFCLPKDIESMKNAFEDKNIKSEFLEMVSKINESKS